MKLGLRRLVLLLVGAQLSAVCLWFALTEAADVARSRPARGRRSASAPPPRDPRISVAWEGRA